MSIGKIAEFDIHKDDWRLYIERLEQYFLVNKIPTELQVPTLITVMGSASYELLVNLCTPAKPKTKTFEQITLIMEKHLQPKPSELSERYKFRNRKQLSSENISDYVAVLKKMSKTCEFGAWLEESLRDQLVCGIKSETIRQRLFAETKLDFMKAYSLAVSMEAAEKDAAAVVDGSSSATGDVKGTVDCQLMTNTRQGGGTGRDRTAGRSPAGEYRQRRQSRVGRAAAPAPASSAPGEREQQRRECRACGGPHVAAVCKFGRYVCRVCNQPGHLRRMCPRLTQHHTVEAEIADHNMVDSEDSDEVIMVELNKLTVTQCKPIYVSLEVHGKIMKFECDTGSAVSCINEYTYNELFSNLKMTKSHIVLRYYTGEYVRPVGVIKPFVKYKDKCMQLDLYVIKNGKTMLVGRQWMASLKIQLPVLDYDDTYVNSNSICDKSDFDINTFSSRYSEVFADGLGRFTGGTVGIHLRPGVRPVFMRARPLAYALRGPVERTLDQLVRDGILTPVERSDWATPIVPVVKKDGSIRICADYKLTLNKVIEVDRYPLPRVEDLLVRLSGGELYSKLDLSQAYAQFELDDSRKYTVINTHKGLFRYNRLVYGLASSPAIFQRRLEQLFADLPRVGVFLDDVIITGSTVSEHMNNLCKVFDRLQRYGLKVKRDKCSFFAKSVVYLGHVISKDGVHTCANKVKSIINTPAPSNVSELRAFIGMVMYYAKFIKNVSTVLAPLYKLLRVGVKYEWSTECKNSFERVKTLLTSSEVLAHYSAELPLVLTTDASSVGVGAVLSHITPSGERPIAYASRSLSAAEKSYSQIDREALAIVFGVRKYHQYLFGRKFVLRTDHKPLTYIFGDKVGIPVMAASRLQRWAVLLSAYNYTIEYVASKNNCADALSRLPDKTNNVCSDRTDSTYVHFVEEFLPVTHEDVKNATQKDIELAKIMSYVQSGWPSECPAKEIQSYFYRRREIYSEFGCLMWGYRMIIPLKLRNLILRQLHSSHLGIVKMKGLARSYVWWPGIDADIEAMCKQCETCAAEADAPPRAPPQPWPFTAQPWTRLHVDFLGPYQGTRFFVLIDASSKWIEIFEMKQTNALSVIKVLRATFARFGLPEEIVSDQGPPFTSEEFRSFLKKNGIRQKFSPAYHPASNGAAENAVKLCKRAIKKAYRDNVDVDTALQTFLLAYRNSVHSTTGETPASMLQRRSLRSRLDLLRGSRSLEDRVREIQGHQAECQGSQSRTLCEGDMVWARQYGGSDKWVKGTVREVEGTRRYVVDSGDGRLLKRHIDQIRRRSRLSDVPCQIDENNKQISDRSEIVEPLQPDKLVEVPECEQLHKEGLDVTQEEGVDVLPPEPPATDQPSSNVRSASPPVMRAKRARKPVVRFEID